MPGELPPDLWRMLTSTVGLVATANGERGVNVMAAEWASFVNKVPLYVSVALGPRAVTRGLIEASGGFSLTLCAEEQASLADFVGSFSALEVDKTTSALLDLGPPDVTAVPWVRGGVLALECRLRRTIALPVHRLFIAEAVAAHLPRVARRPLVKHGDMFGLGAPAPRCRVVVAVRPRPGRLLTVCATGPAATGPDLWRVTLIAPPAGDVPLGDFPSTPFGDLNARITLNGPEVPHLLDGARIRVDRAGAEPGFARLVPPVPHHGHASHQLQEQPSWN
ncbi:flavin reductase family protein [Streptomyces syringium]|uniref:flavin reductase family protein n=1 Tax=Streptomyces syringium TaxID=76729 RepID=UPI0036526501